MTKYIDIGINLLNKQFKGEEEEVIQNALQHGVEAMILTGTSVKASLGASALAKKHPGVLYSTAGIHPHDARNFVQQDIITLENLLKNEHVVAVGECGLDFDRDFSPRTKQEEVFEIQLEIAKRTRKPLFLHERKAHTRFLEIMEQHEALIERSVVHCFTGNTEEVKDYVNRGFYIGITGWICDERRGKDLQEAVKHIPLDRIMIETDGPYLLPRDLKPSPKNRRNEPKYLPHIAKAVAGHMGVSEELFIEKVYQNTNTFFNLKK